MAAHRPPTAPHRFANNPTYNPSAALWTTPAVFSTDGLYNPVLATIVLIEGESKHRFVVPKDLICAKSAYFNNVFAKDFKEAGTGEVELKDVQKWLLQVLISWLYSGRVFLEEILSHKESSGTKKRKIEDVEGAMQQDTRSSALVDRRSDVVGQIIDPSNGPASHMTAEIKDRGQGQSWGATNGQSRRHKADPVS